MYFYFWTSLSFYSAAFDTPCSILLMDILAQLSFAFSISGVDQGGGGRPEAAHHPAVRGGGEPLLLQRPPVGRRHPGPGGHPPRARAQPQRLPQRTHPRHQVRHLQDVRRKMSSSQKKWIRIPRVPPAHIFVEFVVGKKLHSFTILRFSMQCIARLTNKWKKPTFTAMRLFHVPVSISDTTNSNMKTVG